MNDIYLNPLYLNHWVFFKKLQNNFFFENHLHGKKQDLRFESNQWVVPVCARCGWVHTAMYWIWQASLNFLDNKFLIQKEKKKKKEHIYPFYKCQRLYSKYFVTDTAQVPIIRTDTSKTRGSCLTFNHGTYHFNTKWCAVSSLTFIEFFIPYKR